MSTTAMMSRVYDRLSTEPGVDSLRVRRVSLGTNLVLVELASKASPSETRAGVAHRARGLEAGTPPPTEGSALRLARWATDPPGTSRGSDALMRSVGLATLNALSVPYVEWKRGDPMKFLPRRGDIVVTVGFFRPALTAIRARELRIIERNPPSREAVPPDANARFVPPQRARDALEGADLLFVTGSTLIYGGLDQYLRAAGSIPLAVLVGPTASFLPEELLRDGFDLVAGSRVTNPAALRRLIAEEGVCATDCYGNGLEKVYMRSFDPESGHPEPG